MTQLLGRVFDALPSLGDSILQGRDGASTRPARDRRPGHRQLAALAHHPAGQAQAAARDPGGGRADRAEVVGEVRVLESDGCQVRPSSLRMEAVQREPEGEQGDGEVVELAEHGNDARDEVDGAHHVAGGRDDGGAPGLAEHRVLAQAPRQPHVVGQPVEHRGEPVARKRVGRGERRRRGVVGHRAILGCIAIRPVAGRLQRMTGSHKSGISRAS